MKASLTLLIVTLVLVMSVSECRKSNTINSLPEGFTKIIISPSTKSLIDSCGCNDHIYQTINDRLDTLIIINGYGVIVEGNVSMEHIMTICNLPKQLLDSLQSKKYPIIFSGDEHAACQPRWGWNNYGDLILTKLSIKF